MSRNSVHRSTLMRLSLTVFSAGMILLGFTPISAAQTVGGGLLPQYQKFGDAWYDRLGYSLADAGDVNNDGVHDFIVSGIGIDVAGSPNGAVFVYSGIDGSELHRFDGLNPGDSFGFSVDGAGDVDGDGYDDVIIGAPYVGQSGTPNEGRAYVYSGFDGHKLYRFNGAGNEFRMGFSVAGAGDVNGDGLADLLVSSIWSSEGGLTEAGAVDLFSGANGSVLLHWDGGSPRDYFGYSVDGAGDINADGTPDIIIGAANVNVNGVVDAGRVYVFSGATGKRIHRKSGNSEYDWFGFSVAGAGDVNQDGFDDFLVGSLLADPNGSLDAGIAFLYSGETGTVIQRFDGVAAGDNFGGSVAGGNDIDGDGVLDIIIGASGADPNGLTFAGSAYAYSGADYSLIYQVDGFKENDFMGHAVASLPDLGGDGLAEFLVSAHLADNGGRQEAGWFGVMGYHPYLTTDQPSLSASAGGVVNFTMQFPFEYGGQVYKLLGSATGVGPTNLAGIDIPLTDGDFLWDALLDSSPPALFSNPIGTLDAAGQASSALNLPAGFGTSFVGTTFYFAAVLLVPPAEGLLSSAAASLTVNP